MRKLRIMSVIVLVALTGCVSITRQSSQWPQRMGDIKTIAVLPPDVRVYEISTGGVNEEIDEWSIKSKEYIKESLKKHLTSRGGIEVKFVDETWLKLRAKSLWLSQKALYGAVAQSALNHAYPGMQTFETKVKNFDYTLGPNVKQLAQMCGADALVFVSGFDTEASRGRITSEVFNQVFGALLGVSIVYFHPTFLNIGVVDGDSGDVLWFKINNPQSEYSFRNEKNVDSLIEWLTRDLFKKAK